MKLVVAHVHLRGPGAVPLKFQTNKNIACDERYSIEIGFRSESTRRERSFTPMKLPETSCERIITLLALAKIGV
jgi:hypothetical protein